VFTVLVAGSSTCLQCVPMGAADPVQIHASPRPLKSHFDYCRLHIVDYCQLTDVDLQLVQRAGCGVPVGAAGVVVLVVLQQIQVCRTTNVQQFLCACGRFFNVPAAVYPWALLVLWQLIMPGASFLGHLCGVLV